MNKELIKSKLRTVKDFPIPGILFWDITTVFKDPEALRLLDAELYELVKDKGITKVVGLESRGWPMATTLAIKLGAGFVPCRKPGKLPAETITKTYSKEYGTDTIEIHKDAITEDDVVLIHDDLLATGGSANAAIELVKQFNPKKIYANFIIVLKDLPGIERIPEDIEVTRLFDL